MSRTAFQDSTDESINSNNGPVALARVDGERTKGWFTNVLLAITVVLLMIVSIALYAAYKDLQTQVWLRDDALTKFSTGPFADLKAQTTANQALINAYGLQKSVSCTDRR